MTKRWFFTSIGPSLALNIHDPWIYVGKIIYDNILDIQTNRLAVLKLFIEININNINDFWPILKNYETSLSGPERSLYLFI